MTDVFNELASAFCKGLLRPADRVGSTYPWMSTLARSWGPRGKGFVYEHSQSVHLRGPTLAVGRNAAQSLRRELRNMRMIMRALCISNRSQSVALTGDAPCRSRTGQKKTGFQASRLERRGVHVETALWISTSLSLIRA